MQLLDWLRDGLLTDRARFRHTTRTRRARPEREERDDPSGRHDFGRRAHHPDPNGHYEFGSDPTHRMTPPEGTVTGRYSPGGGGLAGQPKILSTRKNGAAGED